MSFLRSMKAGRKFGAIVLAAAVGGAFACNSDRKDVVFQVGDYVFDFLVDQQLAGGYPVGTHAIDDFAVSDVVDTTAVDAFDRATGELGFFNEDNAFAFAAYSLQDLARNGSTDPRLPALGDDDAAIGDFCVMGSPPFGGVGEGAWDLYCSVTNLNPSTRYTVMLARYALTVNGELDANAVLTGEPVLNPDQLTLIGANPAGYPDVLCNFSTLTPIIRDANPLVLGYVDTDVAGGATIDCIPYSTDADPTWWRNIVDALPAGVSDSIPFGPNSGEDGIDPAIPSFNYIVLVEGQGDAGNPVPAGAHALRWQVGNDVSAGNVGINNGVAPYPTGSVFDELSKSEILALPCCTGVPSDLSFSFGSLEALAGSVYQVWLWNEETETFTSPSGNWEATDSEGSLVDDAQGVRTFSSQPGWSHSFTTSDALAGEAVGTYTHVFLSVESSEASSPSTTQPMWSQYTDMDGEPEDPFKWSFTSSGEMAFGSFRAGNPPTWVFNGPGLGEAGYWGAEEGVSDLLVVNYRNLQLPPTGYFYEAWLIHEDGTAVSAGELMTTFEEGYQSLYDLDIDYSLSDYVSTDGLVLRAETRTQLDCPTDAGGCVDSEPFYNFIEYRLTLAPKSGTGDMPVTTVVGAPTPEPVRARKPKETP